jgi:hypothetical protein
MGKVPAGDAQVQLMPLITICPSIVLYQTRVEQDLLVGSQAEASASEPRGRLSDLPRNGAGRALVAGCRRRGQGRVVGLSVRPKPYV